METHETWEFIRNLAVLLNYLLLPIGVALWKGVSYLQKMDKRITKIELLHELKGCYSNVPRDFPED